MPDDAGLWRLFLCRQCKGVFEAHHLAGPEGVDRERAESVDGEGTGVKNGELEAAHDAAWHHDVDAALLPAALKSVRGWIQNVKDKLIHTMVYPDVGVSTGGAGGEGAGVGAPSTTEGAREIPPLSFKAEPGRLAAGPVAGAGLRARQHRARRHLSTVSVAPCFPALPPPGGAASAVPAFVLPVPAPPAPAPAPAPVRAVSSHGLRAAGAHSSSQQGASCVTLSADEPSAVGHLVAADQVSLCAARLRPMLVASDVCVCVCVCIFVFADMSYI